MISRSHQVHQQFSARATLVGLGVKVCKLKVLEPTEQQLQIAQKMVKYTPLDKLTDGLIAILAGAHGLVEINKRVRTDQALQAAFGPVPALPNKRWCKYAGCLYRRKRAANADGGGSQIYRLFSQGYRHAYQERLQLLDIDTDGRPCGKKAAFATKGYFARRPNRRGRQEGYVLATWYTEIVVKRLFSGTTQLTAALQPLVEAAEKTLALTPEQRQRTILRIDSGGGSVDDINTSSAFAKNASSERQDLVGDVLRITIIRKRAQHKAGLFCEAIRKW